MKADILVQLSFQPGTNIGTIWKRAPDIILGTRGHTGFYYLLVFKDIFFLFYWIIQFVYKSKELILFNVMNCHKENTPMESSPISK